ncbi:MAG TPA: transcription antitermination factor NusB [Thermoleophilia bacterium]|nr:transcription antitermination factor NusB [Thermoleophilia bacterium]
MSPARAAALAVLRRLRRENAALDESAAGLRELEGLETRDRALAFELVTGVLRRRGSCDAVLEHAATAPRRIEPDLLDVLRLGAYQLLFLDRVPAYAVVDDAVVMAGRSRHRRGFVNAVLRRVAAEGREVLERLGAGDDDHALSVRFSVPEWIVTLLRRDLGDAAATGVLEAAGQAPERCVRVNTTVIAPVAARAALEAAGYTAAAVDGLDDALVVDGPSLEASAPFRDGLVTPQSRGSQLVAPVAVAGAEGALLDLCAAPGTKPAHLAALRPRARIVAVDVDPGRVEALESNLRRLQMPLAAAGQPGVTAVCADALALPPEYVGAFDAVLVDAPCTGLGTLAARPDLRWRRRPADVARMAALQRRLLAAGAACVRPGGALTYAVCTLTRGETTAVVEAFADGAEWSFDDLGAVQPRWAHPDNGAYLRTLPPRDGSTGFFVARLRRRVSQAGAR